MINLKNWLHKPTKKDTARVRKSSVSSYTSSNPCKLTSSETATLMVPTEGSLAIRAGGSIVQQEQKEQLRAVCKRAVKDAMKAAHFSQYCEAPQIEMQANNAYGQVEG